MHISKPLHTYLLTLTTTTITSATPTTNISLLKCDTTLLSTFIPSNATQPNPDFQHYLQQPLCTSSPTLFGLDAKNRFQEDYELFAVYFNERYTSVPSVCKERFGVFEEGERIPERWDAYVEEDGVKCRKGSGGLVGDGKKGYEKVAGGAVGRGVGGVTYAVVVAVVAMVVQFFGWVMG